MIDPIGTGQIRVALIVVSDLEFGGAQRQVVELCNHMDPARYDVHICSLSGYVPLAQNITARHRRFHLALRRTRFDWTVVPRLGSLARNLQADILHGFLFDAEIASRLAGRFIRAPVIGSERNTDYTIKRSDMLAYRATGWARDLTIANSKAGADFNSRVFKLPRESYRVVHNGVDSERFQPRSNEVLRTELGISPNQILIGMFGSFKPQKNQPLLIRAAKRIIQQFPNARFMFVGDQLHGGMSGSVDFKKEIHDLVDELGLRSACIFPGNQSEVERYYNACDITALPSLFEGTPNVALESMASGVPVVATDVSDNRYVIPEAKAGFIVPSGDETALADRICRLLADVTMRRQMGEAARAWVLQEFTGRRLAEKTADVYDETLRLKGKRRRR